MHVNKILCSLFFVLVHNQEKPSTSSQLCGRGGGGSRVGAGPQRGVLRRYSERQKTTTIIQSGCRRMRKETSSLIRMWINMCVERHSCGFKTTTGVQAVALKKSSINGNMKHQFLDETTSLSVKFIGGTFALVAKYLPALGVYSPTLPPVLLPPSPLPGPLVAVDSGTLSLGSLLTPSRLSSHLGIKLKAGLCCINRTHSPIVCPVDSGQTQDILLIRISVSGFSFPPG